MGTRAPVILAAVLASCAAPRLSSIDPGQEISIHSARATATPTIDLNNRVIGQGAATGAQGGGLFGGLWGLSCGPFAYLCIPAGALVFSGVGALGGVAVGSAQMLPGETKARLLGGAQVSGRVREFESDLAAAIESLAKTRWSVVAGPAAVAVVVRLDAIALDAMRGDRIALSVKATVTVKRAGSEPESKAFEYRGAESDVNAWLDDQDDFVAESFRHAHRHIAHQVISELARTLVGSPAQEQR